MNKMMVMLSALLMAAGCPARAAGAPPAPQGMITMRSYAGDVRQAVTAGTAAADGVFYPKRAEAPYNGIQTGTWDDPGNDAILPPGDWRNSYTAELVGYFYPPKTGKIQFAIAADDAGELWFSTDDNPAGKALIATDPDWHPARAFAMADRRTTVATGAAPVPRGVNQSAYIQVTEGKPYFIQALAMETGGSDNLAVAFRYEGDPEFADGGLPIQGRYLASIDRADPAQPFVSKFAAYAMGFTIDLHDGDGVNAGSVAAGTVKVQLDGAAVAVQVAQTPPVTSVTYAKTDGALAAATSHTVTLAFKDAQGKEYALTKSFALPNYGLKWQIVWTDYAANPVNLQSPGDRAYMPYLLYSAQWPAASRYRVWYDQASNAGLACSTSPDGIVWGPGAALTGINTAASSSDGKEFAGRAVVLYQTEWAKPFRLYYYGRTDAAAHQIWVAESADGIHFENNQVALDPAADGSRLGTFPDGHAVVYLPGRNVTPDDPEAARPFVMYFRDKNGQGIAFAESKDGFTFAEIPDDPETPDVTEGLVRVHGLPEGTAALPAQPTQVLRLAQNDFRLWAFDQNTNNIYLASPNGFDWQVIENPMAGAGGVGVDGAWNDERNYYASTAYLGGGRFIHARSGRSKTGSQLYRTGIAFGESAFYRAADFGQWAFYSPMNDWQAEGWSAFTSTANDPDGTVTALLNNGDGTVSVRDRKDSGNFYMAHDVALSAPFTYEFRARLADALGTGGDEEFPKYMVGAFMTDDLHPGGESWQPAFAQDRFGGWTLASDPTDILDNTQFQTYTVVCRFDPAAQAQLAVNAGNAVANVNLSAYDIYVNRDFKTPKVTFHGTGFLGWGSVDLDGRIDIGFPGPSSGQVDVDWIRWGNGVILDPADPLAVTEPPKLDIARDTGRVRLTWTGGGVLQSADNLRGPWLDETAAASGFSLNASGQLKFYRVRR